MPDWWCMLAIAVAYIEMLAIVLLTGKLENAGRELNELQKQNQEQRNRFAGASEMPDAPDVAPVLKAVDSEELNAMGKVKPEDVPEVQKRLNQMYAQHERTTEEWQATAQYKEPSVMCMECKYAEEIPRESLWGYRLIRCKHPNKPTQEIKIYIRDGCNDGKKVRNDA